MSHLRELSKVLFSPWTNICDCLFVLLVKDVVRGMNILYPGLLRRTLDDQHSHNTAGEVKLPPEIEEGPLEYKLRINAEGDRLLHLTTQLKWRLSEGQGQCWYILGVKDNGVAVGMTPTELEQSITLLRDMAEELGASVEHMDKVFIKDGNLICAQVSIRTLSQAFPIQEANQRDTSVIFVGGAGVGKSTLIGALLGQDRDDGRGSLRVKTLKHRHELLTGRTSSISVHSMQAPTGHNVHLIDSAGLPRFMQRTALAAVTIGSGPDALCIVSDGTQNDAWSQKKWLELAEELGLECIQVQSKVDLEPHNLDPQNMVLVSAVTSQGLSELKDRIGKVCPRKGKSGTSGSGLIVEGARWLSEERQMVLHGMVIGEGLTSAIKPGQHYWVMPHHCRVLLGSIHRQKRHVLEGYPGQAVSVAVDLDRTSDWKGALITDNEFDDSVRFSDQIQTDIRRDQPGVLFLNGNRLQVNVVDGLIRMSKMQVIRRGAFWVFVGKPDTWHCGRIR